MLEQSRPGQGCIPDLVWRHTHTVQRLEFLASDNETYVDAVISKPSDKRAIVGLYKMFGVNSRFLYRIPSTCFGLLLFQHMVFGLTRRKGQIYALHKTMALYCISQLVCVNWVCAKWNKSVPTVCTCSAVL